jgi:hypothetical protein
MRVRLAAYRAPKAGHRDDEYEDAFAPGPEAAHSGSGCRFAVADGATESSYSRVWAERLVRAAVDGRLDLADSSSLAVLQQEWDAALIQCPRPWFAEEKFQQGAFAALVVLELRDDPAPVWHAAAVGDCCLFHLRGGALRVSFPLTRAADFDLRPYLIGSRSDCREVVEHVAVGDDTWEPGDEFLLMSDALARWFLTEMEAGRRPCDELAPLGEPGGFRAWVDRLRRDRGLRNDDTTLLWVGVTE